MKIVRRLTAILFTVCLILSAGAQAVPAGSYTYTITLSAGGKGSFSETMLSSASVEGGTVHYQGPDTIEITGIAYTRQTSSQTEESRINLTQFKNAVVLSDERYYVKGFHISGKEDMAEESIPRTQDAVYVISYGIKGNQVSYTVNYRDGDGNDLLPSETFYGNVGDKPVVAFQYIEGYQPQAYNLTKTLSSNESENVFTFTYTSAATGTGGTEEVEDRTTDGTTAMTSGTNTQASSESTTAGQAGTGTGTGGTTAAATAPAANTFTTGGTANAGANAGNATNEGTVENGENLAGAGAAEAGQENIPDEGVPAELTDLDDEDVPLANTKLDSDGDGQADAAGVADAILPLRNLPLPLRVFLTALVIGILGIGLWFILSRRKRRKEAGVESTESVIENNGGGGAGKSGGSGQ